MSQEAAKNTSIAMKNKAYAEIRERILNCAYKPGTWLNEDLLCEDLGISRTPVRDALSRLEQDGLIVIYPKRGSYITDFSLDIINAIYETRFLIEPFVLQSYGPRLDDRRLLEYLNRFSDVKQSLASIETPASFDADDEFHWMLISVSENQFLRKTYQNIQSQNRRLRVFAHKLEDRRIDDSYAEHVAIITACLKHDWESAAQNMRTHLNRSKDSTFRLFLQDHKRTPDL